MMHTQFLFRSILIITTFAIYQGFSSELEISFAGQHGQIEVGGKYVGVEFHHSRPLPSRLSFYYPVANSLDLSRDYWKRDESMPFSLLIDHNGQIDTIGYNSYSYRYTPFSVGFDKEFFDYKLKIRYEFCENIPVLVFKILLENTSKNAIEFKIQTGLQVVLRSCHTYEFIPLTSFQWSADRQTYIAGFDNIAADSALFFISNVGEKSINKVNSGESGDLPRFFYQRQLEPGMKLEISQLIGSCKTEDSSKIVSEYSLGYQAEGSQYNNRVEQYALHDSPVFLADSILEQTIKWSKAVLESNIHYLDGQYVPMPCPAEYNFFFTHDALLTDLGAVHFDLERVKKDLLYLKSLSRADSVLPHAYYWKDNQYVTEFCGSDNWNHFWFIILANSYLKHSGDLETIQTIFPIISKSLKLVMKNKGNDDLLYGTQPDWWDIGKIYGARAYISLLMIRALQDYAALSTKLNLTRSVLPSLELANRMRGQLLKKLWSEDAEYLLNMLDLETVDEHFYAGSLIGAAFDILDRDKKMDLIQTAERELLDKNLGIRNAMPADFHLLVDVYKFQGTEMGAPYIYANGGIWPQGTIWYCLGLIELDQIEKATRVLKQYLTLEGIRNSPNGQPSFYEYRNANAGSSEYGKIDKPTFTWAGGWYLYTIYRLLGARENPWNIYLTPLGIQNERISEYPLTILGKDCEVSSSGEGNYFQSILFDDRPVYSVVLSHPAEKIELIRGNPSEPYLSDAQCIIRDVDYNPETRIMKIQAQGVIEQALSLEVISPLAVKQILLNDEKVDRDMIELGDGEISRMILKTKFPQTDTEVKILFEK